MPRTERVLMTADAVGGVWTFALDLARVLEARGVQVLLAVLGPAPDAAQRAEAAAIPSLLLEHRPFALEWMPAPWADVDAAGEWLLTLEAAFQPDVVHLNGFAHAALGWRAPVLVAGHSCVLSWWRGVHGCDAPPQWDTYAERVRAGIHAADLVVAPSGAMLAQLERHYGAPRQSRVISNGRAPVRPPAAPREPFVLTAGRLWDEAKNVTAVCDVAGHVRWPVRVAGDMCPPGGGDVVPCAGVEYLGRLDSATLAGWMQRAAVYALPARYEPFGLSALEAALGGCALVLGDIRSLREVWGDAALYVPPDNRRMLAAAIRLLMEDDAFRAELAARAQARARTYTPARTADGYLAAYAAIQGRVAPATAPAAC